MIRWRRASLPDAGGGTWEKGLEPRAGMGKRDQNASRRPGLTFILIHAKNTEVERLTGDMVISLGYEI